MTATLSTLSLTTTAVLAIGILVAMIYALEKTAPGVVGMFNLTQAPAKALAPSKDTSVISGALPVQGMTPQSECAFHRV